ncbi:PPE domain-containing protein [Mycobacterium lepromatosis]|uniref:PPE domain-containing protein n=1 Tax=Mycobacterium lepromatosis TaxID=480418 RepID=UPI000AD46B4E
MWIPPEINSAFMIVSPGSGPLITPAAAQDQLAEDRLSSPTMRAATTSCTSSRVSHMWASAAPRPLQQRSRRY